MKLARAIVFVKDVDRMTAFYRDALGLAEVRREPGWVELDGVALHAIPPGLEVSFAPREDTPIKLAFACDDVAAARARLTAAGATMREVRPWGSCDGVDPEGNVFQIVVGSPP
jgi:catechol 2,3-dioxygenase-like lactoylglutathione lyase family enzyme